MKSEHDFVEEPEPPTDPARGGLDDQLLGLFLKNYDIVSAIAEIDPTDSPLVTRARIPAAHLARDSSPLPFGRLPQPKQATCGASLEVPSLRLSRSTGNLLDGQHTPLSSGDEHEPPVTVRPRWDHFRDRLLLFYADVRGALAETNDNSNLSKGNHSTKLSAYILRRDIKRCLSESHPYAEFVAGVREILIWRNPIASMAMFFVYMYCLFRGWLLPTFLFLVLLQLTFNYIRTQKGIDLGLCLLPRRETPMPRVELSGAQLVFEVARRAQILLTFLADLLEKTKALFTWEHPDVSRKFFMVILAFFLASAVFPNGVLLTFVGKTDFLRNALTLV
ncbi:Protein Y77E11A.12 a [Aphelenchoides avenae]|nr:Protein Y77E11A.12 a [Aphelenchus avenae]